MKKGLLVSALATSIILSCAAVNAADDEVTVYLDGTQLQFEQPPVIQNGTTLVPMRALFEALGAEVDWDGESQYINAISYSKGQMIGMYINDNTIIHNGIDVYIDVAPQLINGYTMIPLRVVSECMDTTVEWGGDTKSIYIRNKNSIGTIYGDNFAYVGQYFNNVPNGYGIYYIYDDNNNATKAFVAYFENGAPVQGYASYFNDNGNDLYRGTFINWKQNGQGTLTYAEGDIYVGSFRDNLYDGAGTIYFANGNVFSDENFTAGNTSGNGIWQIGGAYYTEQEINQQANQQDYYEAVYALNKWHSDAIRDYQNALLDGSFYSDFLESDIAKNIYNRYHIVYDGTDSGNIDSYSKANAEAAQYALEVQANAEVLEAYNLYVQEYPEYLNNLYNEKLAALKVQYGIVD